TGSREPLGARSLSGHFVVRATRPGVVEVDVRGNTLWVYSRGAGWEPSDWTRSATILARAFPAHSGDWRTGLVRWLTQRIVESRHGGTLVIVEPHRLSNISILDEQCFDPASPILSDAWHSYADMLDKFQQTLSATTVPENTAQPYHYADARWTAAH